MVRYEEEVDLLLKKFIAMGVQDDFAEMRGFLASLSPKIQYGQIMRESPSYWNKFLPNCPLLNLSHA